MNNSDWVAAQGQPQIPGQVNNGGEAANAAGMDGGEWRSQLPPESRHRIVTKVMETLKRHLPYTGPDGMQELRKIALRFEEKVYSAATSQPDYLRKISMKMMSMDNKSQNPMANPLPPNAANNSTNPPDPASQNMLSQMQSQVLQLPVPMGSNQSQVHQQPLSQNNIVSTGLPSSVGGMSQGTMSSSVPMNPSNLQNAAGTSMGLGVPPQRQIQGRQQQQIVAQEQQQQSQNSQQYLYSQQQLQQNRMNQNLQQGNVPQSMMQQSQIQQQHKPLQPNQLQSSQQSLMQPSLRQISNASTLQSNQQSSPQKSTQALLQQQSQSVRQQSSMPQHPMLSLQQQQQQQLMDQQLNTGNVQQNQLIGQQNSMLDPQQQHQQQQRVMAQQNISGLQQQQAINHQNPNMHQQQPSVQQNNHSNVHQQHIGVQTNLSSFQPGFQQQQMGGIQHGNPNLQPNQQSVPNLQNSKVPVQQQTQQNISNIMPNQSQQPQTQLTQHQLGLRQQGNPMQRDMQNRIQESGPLLQQQTTIDRQNQSLQSPSVVPDPSANPTMQSGNGSGGNWQEEAYQRIKSLREMYYSELNEMYQRLAAKLQQHDALPQQPIPEQFEKLRMYKTMVERLLMFLRTSKNEILPIHREKIPGFEKQILNIINPNRPRKPQGSFVQPQGQAMQQSQQKEPQVSQVHGSESQINSEMQPMNINGSAIATQHNNLTGLQQTSLSPGTGISNVRQNMMDASKPGLNADPRQGHALNQTQQVAMSSLQQHHASSPQQMNINAMPSQTALTTLQPNSYSLQANSNVSQPLQIKREQQMFPTQQVKQLYQQRQMQQQYLHSQQLMQQQQQATQQQPTQFPAPQIIQQLNDTKDVKMRPQMSAKPGLHLQHHLYGQRPSYHQQPMKSGSPFSVSSQQAASPQIGHHSSPQVDLHSLLSSYKAGTPLQSANSPFIAPSPSTSMAQSPAQSDIEKLIPGMPSLSTAGNVMNQSTGTVSVPSQSLAIGTQGISASPLLAEFTSTDGTHGAASTVLSGNSSALGLPIQRLINAVKALSPKALSASVNDITSVVSMVDRIAGSAPGNDSRAAVGEDLVAMTKCRLQARNVLTQDEPGGTKKMRRYKSAIPSNVISSTGSKNDNTRHISGNESDGESTGASSSIKRPRVEANNALEEELRKINQRLIDTAVCISEDDVDPTAAAAEGGGGIFVKCSFLAVALSPNLKTQYASAQMSPIQPLRLLIPNNYPNCSPIILDNFPDEVSKEYEDLSTKTKSRFSISLKALEQPMTLAEMARTWDDCAHTVITEYAQQSGGGSFSSKYGKWENCLSAA